MNREATVRTYLAAMAKGDLPGVLACFTPEGLVSSPVYGGVPVADFYNRLFGDTAHASVDIRSIFHTNDGQRIAALFAYQWELKNGTRTACDLVDIFDFAADSGLIAHLQIIFDTDRIGKA